MLLLESCVPAKTAPWHDKWVENGFIPGQHCYPYEPMVKYLVNCMHLCIQT